MSVWLRRLAWATLVSNIVLVVTGGAVRLTGSGLGCPTWPRCNEGSFTPHGALTVHQAIEFGNRTLTFVLAAVAIATYVAARRSGRADLSRLALLLGLAIPLQAIVGGITVLTDLNPWVVSFHLLASLTIVSVAVLFLWRLDRPATPAASGPVLRLALATYAVAWAVLYLGTVVTGSGPHAGDADVPRNGLGPLELSQAHADLVFLFIGLTVGLVFALRATGGTAHRAVTALVAVEVVQAAIGFVQYFTGLPIVVLGLHMLGAALVVSAATWVLLAVREPAPTNARSGGGATPAPPWPGEAPPQR